MTDNPLILVIEDEASLTTLLRYNLDPSLTTRFEVCCLSMRWRAIIPRMALHVGCLCRIRGQTIIFLMPPGAGSAPST